MSADVKDDMKLSDTALDVFFGKFKHILGFDRYELLKETPDWKLSKDAIFHLKDGRSIDVSYRFRQAISKGGFSIYPMQDITFRFERPSGFKSDLSKMNAKWFIYGVLTHDEKDLSRVVVVLWTNAFENYLIKHPLILSNSIPNRNGSSSFKAVKIKDIPDEFVHFKYDYKEEKQISITRYLW